MTRNSEKKKLAGMMVLVLIKIKKSLNKFRKIRSKKPTLVNKTKKPCKMMLVGMTVHALILMTSLRMNTLKM